MRSFEDSMGHRWIACSECNRGGNGTEPDKCSCGGTCKRFNGMGCFSGELKDKYKEELKNGR
jgi:hypothetical protein